MNNKSSRLMLMERYVFQGKSKLEQQERINTMVAATMRQAGFVPPSDSVAYYEAALAKWLDDGFWPTDLDLDAANDFLWERMFDFGLSSKDRVKHSLIFSFYVLEPEEDESAHVGGMRDFIGDFIAYMNYLFGDWELVLPEVSSSATSSSSQYP